MKGEKRAVFISSTSEDLETYRQAARDVALEQGLFPEMMEVFTADASPTIDACQQRVRHAVAVIMILAFRRGWVPSPEQGGDGLKSIVAWELAAADSPPPIPVFVFMAEPTWPGNLWEHSDQARAWLQDFRGSVNRIATMFEYESPRAEGGEQLPIFKSKVRDVLNKNRDRFAPASEVAADVAPKVRTLVRVKLAPLANEPPSNPYPVLEPYDSPATFAGREAEVDELWRLLQQRQPLLCIHAPSGAGKSSVLQAGLLPRLAQERIPATLDIHPDEPGLAARLLGGIIDGDPPTLEHRDWRNFAADVDAVSAQGKAPIFILDQFEVVFRQARRQEVLSQLGPLLAQSFQRLSSAPVRCRWLLAYRQDFHGDVMQWLEDVLMQARSAGQKLDLPHDLRSPDRCITWSLPVLGQPQPGGDSIAAATRSFVAAILKPLEVKTSTGNPLYPLTIDPADAERLARTFAEKRAAQPDLPLTPQLQVVLARLVADADPGANSLRRLVVPADTEALVRDALDTHLHRALNEAYPATRDDQARVMRTRVLLALREMCDADGRRARDVPESTLSSSLRNAAPEVIEKLTSTRIRLIVPQPHADGTIWYSLPHDSLAEAVSRLFRDDARLREYALDQNILSVWNLVRQRSEFYKQTCDRAALDLTRAQTRAIRRYRAELWWDDTRNHWWEEARAQRDRRDRRLLLLAATGAVATLTLVAIIPTSWWLLHKQRLQEQTQSEATQIFSTIGVESNSGLTAGELKALWELAESSRDVRLAVLQQGISTPQNALRFGRRSDELIQASVGLNRTLQADVRRDVIQARCYKSALEGASEEKYKIYACSSLIVDLDQESVEAVQYFLTALDHAGDFREFESHAIKPSRLADWAKNNFRDDYCRLLLAAIKKTEFSERLRFLAESLASLDVHLDTATAEEAGAVILGVMSRTNERFQIGELGQALGALQMKLKPETVEKGARIILAAMTKTNKPYEIAELGLALGSLQPRVKSDIAEGGARLITTAMTKTTEAVELQSLARGFHSLVGSLKPETVDEAAQEILRAMNLAITKHTLPEAEVGELAESLSSVAGKLKPETADHGAAVILAAMEMKDTPNIMGQFSGTEGEHGSDQIALGSSLAKSLVSFSTVISTEGAERVSRRIFTDIETRTKDPQLDYFAEAFEPVVNKLTPQGARALFLDMLAATSKSTEMNGLSYLAESLGKLGTKLTSDLTEKAELVILETMRKRTENYRSSRKGDRLRIESDEETAERLSALTDAENDKRLYFKQMKGLACSLELVARTLDKHVPGRGAELILTAIEKTADHYMLVYLGHSFAALVAELDSNLADRGSERILGAMGKAAEDHDLHDPIEGLAEGLASLREKLKQETAQRAEDLIIMAAMEQAPDKEKLESLVRALGSFGDRGPQTYAEKGLQKLLDYIRNDTAPDCSAAAPLVRKDTVHIIIELLKWPNCSSEQRDLLITKIGEVNGRSFVEGIEGRLTRPKLSAFTNWAEQQGYDIARPPAKY